MDQTKASRARTAAFWLLLLLATWAAIEAVSLVAFSAFNRALFSYGRIRAEMAAGGLAAAPASALSGRTSFNWADYVEVLHPYFGFVADPTRNKPSWAVSDFGFVFNGDTDAITKRAPGRIVVAVFGGSFANGVFPALRSLVQAKASALGKEIQFVNFSSAGYKQPQQLMVLNYLMALGAEFDIVVNVDGFNDVVLPYIENVRDHVNPFFPRLWNRRTSETISPADLRKIGYVEFLKARRAGWARRFEGSRLYFSPTLCLVWQYGDRAMSRAIYAAEQEILAEGDSSRSYTMRGPKYNFTDDRRLFQDLADVWRNSSEQMATLCAARGIRYYHFLQPNQYVPNSKPMAAEERMRAAPEGNPYQVGVVGGYPFLVKAGDQLKGAGIQFFDLTQIFAGVREPVYNDNCCHLNAAGYVIVARRIWDEIGRD